MPEKYDLDTPPGVRLLRVFRKLALNDRKYYQADLAREFRCSSQTIIRIMADIESVIGVSLESGLDNRRRWYRIAGEKRAAAPGIAAAGVAGAIKMFSLEDSCERAGFARFAARLKKPAPDIEASLALAADTGRGLALEYGDEGGKFSFAPVRLLRIGGSGYAVGAELDCRGRPESLAMLEIAAIRAVFPDSAPDPDFGDVSLGDLPWRPEPQSLAELFAARTA